MDGPLTGVARQPLSFRRLSLTPFVIKVARGSATKFVKKAFEASKVLDKWSQTAWAKKNEQTKKRAALTDFERFKLMKLRKQVCFCPRAVGGSSAWPWLKD